MNDSTHLISEPSETNNSDDEVQEITITGIMKNSVSDIISKLELNGPTIFQNYSDLHSRYIHSIKDLFVACNSAEKQYFGNMPIDQKFLKIFDGDYKFMSSIVESNIDVSTDFIKSYLQFKLLLIDSWNQNTQIALDAYAKILSQFIQKRNLIWC